MNPVTDRTAAVANLRGGRLLAAIEIALIFAVFFLHGVRPVPDSNEPHYLGKAIHYWNPQWLQDDFFMESADTHKVFCFAFGWLSLWLQPATLAWTGRILTWLLLAWSWRRLSVAVVPRPWYSILTAALFVSLMGRCTMAGEWVIGGVEAKGFAYVFVFLGLESMVRNRWNRALLLLGAAAALHVIVGGWNVIAVGMAWLLLVARPTHVEPARALPSLRSLLPGIFGGMLLALPGVIPSLTLDWGVDAATVRQAHQIYVFERLPHHLTLSGIRSEFILRILLLLALWLLLPRMSRSDEKLRRLRAYVAGAVAISLVGAAIEPLIYFDRTLAADLLRYYWFRTADVALPLGVALELGALLGRARLENPAKFLRWAALAMLLLAFHFGNRTLDLTVWSQPQRSTGTPAWREACRWVANPKNIPPDARFFVPRLAQSFKWYTGRSDVVNWKDVPQEASALVEWWNRIEDLYACRNPDSMYRWCRWSGAEGVERLRQAAVKYDADYAIADINDPPLDLPAVYGNSEYVIYRLR